MRDFQQKFAGLVIALATLTAALPCRAETVTLRADQWCPYNCAPDADKPGFVVEMAKEIFGHAGIQVDYGLMNWARSITDARSGRYDGIIGAIRGDAPDFEFPLEPVGQTIDGFAVRKGASFRLDASHPFDGKVVGAVSSYAYGDDFQPYLDANKDDRSKLQLVSGDDALAQNLAKLAEGRLDVVVDDSNVLAQGIVAAGLQDKIVIADRGKPVPIYIAFAPAGRNAKAYASLLTAGIAEIRASGRLSAILARYNVSDWK